MPEDDKYDVLEKIGACIAEMGLLQLDGIGMVY
jgi:hypothetical protein